MAYEPKDGSGALFKNDKGDNPARPDYRGDIMLGGVLYELSGWIKPIGEKRMLSLSGKVKQATPQNRQQSAPTGRQPAQQGNMQPSPKMRGFDEDFTDSSVPF